MVPTAARGVTWEPRRLTRNVEARSLPGGMGLPGRMVELWASGHECPPNDILTRRA